MIVVPRVLISQSSLQQAYHLCQSIEEKDTIYVATSIESGFPLITTDKKLFDGLKECNFAQVILLNDVIKQLRSVNDIEKELSEN